MIKLIILSVSIILFLFLYRFISSYSLKKKIFFSKLGILFLSLIFIFILTLTVLRDDNTEKKYFPAEFDGEKIRPGFFSD